MKKKKSPASGQPRKRSLILPVAPEACSFAEQSATHPTSGSESSQFGSCAVPALMSADPQKETHTLHELAASQTYGIEVRSVRRLDVPERDAQLVGGWLDCEQGSVFWPAIVVSGWVVTKDPLVEASVLCVVGDRTWPSALTIDRPDVIEAKSLSENCKRCGFSVLLTLTPMPGQLSIRLQLNGVVFDWWEIELAESTTPDPRSAAWAALLGRPMDGVAVPASRALRSSLNILFRELTCFSTKSEVRSAQLPEEQKELLLSLITEYSANTVAESMLREAIDTKSLTSRSIWRGSKFRLVASHCYDDVNLLFFSSAGLNYVVVQYAWTAVGVYVPAWGCLLVWTNWRPPFLDDVLSSALSNLLSTPNSFVYKDLSHLDRSFAGFLIGNSRPYHFFYDQLPLIFEIAGEEAQQVFQLSSHSFFSIQGLVAGSVRLVEYQDLNAALTRCNGFALMVGRGAELNPNHLEVFKNIRNWSLEKQLPTVDLSRHFPVIWLGISVQKRIWKEQVEGLAYIIKELQARFPGLAVVFDGWTSPIKPTLYDQEQINQDRKVVQSILEQCTRLPNFDLIGASSMEKIAIAEQCDYYVTNWLQGSLHVDNIARKHGIGHFNTRWAQFESIYRHNHCIRIADEYIVDDSGYLPDWVSYSIDPKHVLEALLRAMDEVPLSKVRPLKISPQLLNVQAKGDQK